MSPLLISVLWELRSCARSRAFDARIVPAPSMILGTFKSPIESGELMRHVGVSLTWFSSGCCSARYRGSSLAR